MKKTAIVFCMAITAGSMTVATVASADKIKDISCAQFLAMDDDAQNNIVYWVEGADVASTKKAVSAADVEVGFDAFGRPVAEVVTACEADEKASLWEKIKKHF